MDSLVQLAILVAIVLGVIGLMALRRIVFARMAMRNIVRRKKFSAIIVVGLLIATAMISAALVVGDTMDYIIKKDVYTALGDVDIVIALEDEAGLHVMFNQSVAYRLVEALDAGDLQFVDGVAPAIREVTTVVEPVTGDVASSAYIYAYDLDNIVNDLQQVDGAAVTRDQVSDGKTVINEELADALGVVVGDTIVAYPKNAMPAIFEVSAIAADDGMGVWRFSGLMFLDLSYAQESVFAAPSMVNVIDVSCKGTMEKGYLLTDDAIEEVEGLIPGSSAYTYSDVKREGVEEAEAVSDMISQIFVLMSTFTIIAGIALIVNIFVMLAEERKSEMGISRAIGMQRGHLTQTFVFEGIVYALIAAAVGTFFGLIIAFVMVNAFAMVIGGTGLTFELHFEWDSLGFAAAAGFLITMVTVVAASWRVSRLNIVRAIRDIPEPILAKSESKYLLSGIAALAFGVLFYYSGVSLGQAAGTSSGMALLCVGAAMVAVRFVKPRWPFTIAGAWMIYYMLDPLNIEAAIFGELQGDLEMFIISGVMMVTGAVMIAIFNSDVVLETLTRLFGRGKNVLPVFRAAVSYPMNKKFRTGLTLFIFALIMFTVIVIAMIASFQRESVDTLSEKFSGGFEIVGYSLKDIPEENLTSAIEFVDESLGTETIQRVETASVATVTMSLQGDNETVTRGLIGFSDSLLTEGRFSLAERADAYESDKDAWNAVLEDPSLTILDGSVVYSMFSSGPEGWYVSIGDVVTVASANGSSTNLTVIGIMDSILVAGAYTTKEFVWEHATGVTENLHYIDTIPGTGISDDEVLKQFEKGLAEFGLNGIVVRDGIEEIMEMSASIMQLMEIFLGVGLIVGISGLGIITIRNIAERRQEIGVMRAIGYQRNMILNTFLLETSFVALLGIVMGVVLGLLLSFRLFDWGGFSEISEFVIPWGEVAIVLVIAFTVTILATLPPSRRAARLAPAEALRRID